MKRNRFPFVLGPIGLVFAFACALPAAAEERSLVTTFNLLVGFPDQPDSAVAMIPGTVIPDHTAPSVDRTLERSEILAVLAKQLRETMRLGQVEIRYEQKKQLHAGGAPEDLPAPSSRSSFVPNVALLEVTDQHATYQVRFRQGAQTVHTVPVTVIRGRRSVVGMLDGPEAPYVFLVVEPRAIDAPAEVKAADVTPPRLIRRTDPVYPRDAGDLEGTVVLEVVIGTDGQVRDIKVLHGLHPAYDGAAVDSVRQWLFEPATEGGKPVEVRYTLTIRFVPT
jgi:protein TonB